MNPRERLEAELSSMVIVSLLLSAMVVGGLYLVGV